MLFTQTVYPNIYLAEFNTTALQDTGLVGCLIYLHDVNSFFEILSVKALCTLVSVLF